MADRLIDTGEPRRVALTVWLSEAEATLLYQDLRQRQRGEQTINEWLRAAVLARLVKHRLVDGFTHDCRECGKPFVSKRHDARYCPDNSGNCRQKARRFGTGEVDSPEGD